MDPRSFVAIKRQGVIALPKHDNALLNYGIALIICAIAIIVLLWVFDSLLYLEFGCLTLMAISPFLFSRIDFLQPIYWFSIEFLLHICVRSLLIAIGWRPLTLSSPYLTYSMALALLQPAMLIAGIGFVSFMIGYFSPFSKYLGAKLRYRISFILLPHKGVINRLFFIWLLGWIFRIASVLKGGSSFWINVLWSNYIQPNPAEIGPLDFLASIRRIGLIGLWSFYFRQKDRSSRLIMFCYSVLGIEMIFGIASGLKQYMIEPILGVAVAYAIGRPGARIRFRLILTIVIIAMISVLWVGSYRYQTLDVSPNLAKQELIRDVLVYGSRQLSLDMQSLIEQIGNRLDLDYLLLIMAYVPERIPFAYGGTFLPQMALNFVPQFLWHGRSSLSRDFFIELSGPSIGGTAPTLFGDLYFNFGVIGVFVGMLFVGFIVKTLYAWLASDRSGDIGAAIIFGSLLLRWFDIVGLGMINILYPLVRELPIGLVIMWLIRDKRTTISIDPEVRSLDL